MVNFESLNVVLVGKYIGLIVLSFIVVVPMGFAIYWSVHVMVELMIVVIWTIITKIQSIKCLLYNFNPMKIFSIWY